MNKLNLQNLSVINNRRPKVKFIWDPEESSEEGRLSSAYLNIDFGFDRTAKTKGDQNKDFKEKKIDQSFQKQISSASIGSGFGPRSNATTAATEANTKSDASLEPTQPVVSTFERPKIDLKKSKSQKKLNLFGGT